MEASFPEPEPDSKSLSKSEVSLPPSKRNIVVAVAAVISNMVLPRRLYPIWGTRDASVR